MRTALTFLLWTILVCAVASVAARAAIAFLIIGLFGRDPPGTTVFKYLGYLSVPPLLTLAMVAGSVVSLRLWRRPRGQYASFPIALAIAGLAAIIWIETAPR